MRHPSDQAANSTKKAAAAHFQHLMDDRWQHGVETAGDVTLVGRYYERFADHAVSVAQRVVYLVTGEHAGELTTDGPA
jgi:phosphate transport system protein